VKAVTGNERLGAGLKTEFDINSKRLATYDAALWWYDPAAKVVLSHESNNKNAYQLGSVALSVFK
jgi:hypothetical protein